MEAKKKKKKHKGYNTKSELSMHPTGLLFPNAAPRAS
jgi:hypothetical protein